MADQPDRQSAPLPASSHDDIDLAINSFLSRLKRPCLILVAYSGGGDSTGLLVALHERLQKEAPGSVTLVAATVDHGLRGGSAEEAERAGNLCKALGVEHHVLTWGGEKPKTAIQAEARQARYRLLAECAQSVGAAMVVTGHTLDDTEETAAMRRARNPEAEGGISEAVLVDRSVWVLRPFLDLRRQAIRRYLDGRSITWIEDPSNDNPAFERVRVRRSLTEGAAAPKFTQRSGVSLVDRSAADFLAQYVRIHSGLVAELDWSVFDAGNSGHRLALFALAAMMGGRSHLAGRDQRLDMLAALGDADFRRGSAGRVIFERRGNWLFIGREDRDIPEMEIAPGQAVEWDGRFEIRNRAATTIRVGKGGFPLFGVPLSPALPALVLKRAIAAQPSLKSGDPGEVEIVPIIAFGHHFLTADRLELANKLAFLGGLNQFPMMPFA